MKNNNYTFQVCSEESTPYFAFKPGYYQWDIKRWIDRFLYEKFNQGKALVVLQRGERYLALLGEEGYVLVWYKTNHYKEKGYWIT